MLDRLKTVCARMQGRDQLGPYTVWISGNTAYVWIPSELFFPALEELLEEAGRTPSKYASYERVLALTSEQIREIILGYHPMPLRQMGFQKLYEYTGWADDGLLKPSVIRVEIDPAK